MGAKLADGPLRPVQGAYGGAASDRAFPPFLGYRAGVLEDLGVLG